MVVHAVEAKLRVPAQEMENKLKASAGERGSPVDLEDGRDIETKEDKLLSLYDRDMHKYYVSSHARLQYA